MGGRGGTSMSGSASVASMRRRMAQGMREHDAPVTLRFGRNTSAVERSNATKASNLAALDAFGATNDYRFAYVGRDDGYGTVMAAFNGPGGKTFLTSVSRNASYEELQGAAALIKKYEEIKARAR